MSLIREGQRYLPLSLDIVFDEVKASAGVASCNAFGHLYRSQ